MGNDKEQQRGAAGSNHGQLRRTIMGDSNKAAQQEVATMGSN
jgi:hypothetical protein